MKVSNMGDALGAVLTIALVTTLLIHKNTSSDVKAIGSSATAFLKTAMTGK